MVRRWKLKQLGLVAVAMLVVNGCGSEKKNNEGYDLQTESIFANGCLNLQNLYANLHRMPGDAMVRAFTYDFSAADKEEDGSSPSSSRLRVLTRAAYFYSESHASEIRSSWANATQSDCSQGTLIDVYGNSTPFTVEEFADNWIKVKLEDESTHRFILTSERSMRITSEELRGSQCIYDHPLRTTTEVALRWGPTAELPTDEAVSAKYMRALSQAVPEAPVALRSSVNDVTTDSISLATSLLRDMNSMEVNPRDQNDCPRKNKPPTAEPLPTPTPDPDPTPAPEETPIPPVENPEGTPAPDVQPQPEATPDI